MTITTVGNFGTANSGVPIGGGMQKSSIFRLSIDELNLVTGKGRSDYLFGGDDIVGGVTIDTGIDIVFGTIGLNEGKVLVLGIGDGKGGLLLVIKGYGQDDVILLNGIAGNGTGLDHDAVVVLVVDNSILTVAFGEYEGILNVRHG